jgi:hypothetical protein
VRDGGLPMVTGEDGLETLRLALNFVQSGSAGHPIALAQDRV